MKEYKKFIVTYSQTRLLHYEVFANDKEEAEKIADADEEKNGYKTEFPFYFHSILGPK
jgi:hypothetical protein